MITQAVMDFAAGFVGWLCSLFPASPDLSSATGSASSGLASLLSSFAGLGGWVNWGMVGVAIALVLSCYGIGLAIKLVLKIAAFIPLVGGSG